MNEITTLIYEAIANDDHLLTGALDVINRDHAPINPFALPETLEVPAFKHWLGRTLAKQIDVNGYNNVGMLLFHMLQFVISDDSIIQFEALIDAIKAET